MKKLVCRLTRKNIFFLDENPDFFVLRKFILTVLTIKFDFCDFWQNKNYFMILEILIFDFDKKI